MKKITRFLFCTFVAIMLMGTAISATACHQKEEYPSVPEVNEPQPTGEIIPTVDRQKELKDARKKYSEAVAWLYMPGAEVDDPVVQAKDNAYYLQKDENGNYSEWGCYYAHCDNHLGSRSKLDRNTVILSRKEYLGHTVTAKSYKVSYKSKKTRRNSEEKQYFFPNTHEALIDEETFDLAQKRIATKHRPTKCDEIDLFSGLLFCGDCGYKMYLQQGAGTLERKHAYTCGRYRNRIRTGEVCTTHYIRKNVLKELVLGELDHLFRKLYEDNALGRLSDQQFTFMVSGYDDEKAALVEKIRGLEKEVSTVTERRDDVGRFVQIVRKYTDVQELSYEIVHEFIDRILVYELDKDTNTRKVEIYYSFVGQVDTGEAHTESVSFFRQIGADVKSYAV